MVPRPRIALIGDGARRGPLVFVTDELEVGDVDALPSADAAVLDVDPERVGEWIERLELPLLLREPVAGSIEELDAIRERLDGAGREAMVLRRFGFALGPLQAAKLRRRERLGAIRTTRLRMRSQLRGNLRGATDDKARYDLLFEDVADLLSVLAQLGADLSSARLESPLDSSYWDALRLSLAGGFTAELVQAEGPPEEVELVGERGAYLWRRDARGETTSIRHAGRAPKTAAVRSRPFPDGPVSYFLSFLERGLPVYESLGRARDAYRHAVRLLDAYLYERALELRNQQRDRAVQRLRRQSPLHARLTPYSYQDWSFAFRADREICEELTRPVSGPYSLLLVRAPFPIHTDTVAPPLGIAQLASVARDAGIDVTLVDLAPELRLEPGQAWDDASTARVSAALERKIDGRRFDMAGLSLDDLTMWPMLQRLSSEVIRPRADRVVLGGRPAGRVDRDAILRSGAVDYVVEGEGELGLIQLVRHHTDGAPLEEVSGLWAASWPRDRPANPPIFPSFELHGPPVFDGLDLSAYRTKKPGLRSPYLSYLFILGCPYRCAFCGNESAQRPRHRPADQVVEHLRALRDRYEVSDFYFLNNMINTNDEVLAELLAELERANLGVRWADCGRPAKLDRATLRRMAEVGCVELTWGVDTGSQRLHNLMRKGYKIETAVEVLRMAHEAGIDNNVNLIIGMPHETEEDFRQTLEFVRENHSVIRSFAVHPYFYAYKSPVRNTPTKFGLRRKGDVYDEVGGSSWRTHLENRDRWVRTLREEIARLEKEDPVGGCEV